MIRLILTGALILTILAIAGCDKEKIVTSSEIVKETEYIELPPDTVLQIDTVFSSDSVIVNQVDTVTVYDTVVQIEQHWDTVVQVQQNYDTTFITDTVLQNQCNPNEVTAFAALQHYSDPMVFDVVNQEFGITGGWTLYSSAYQLEITSAGTGVYDIYGLIDYWTDDFSGFHPFEFFWRMTYVSGDPADPNNWDISEPPVAVSGYSPGLHPAQEKISPAVLGR